MDQFTNIDPRLNPTEDALWQQRAGYPPEYPVNSTTLPLLYAEIEAISKSSGVSGYSVVILGNRFGGAGIYFKRKTIGIGIEKLNSMNFPELSSIISHEMGHAFRYLNTQSRPLGRPIIGLTALENEEVEADRFSACLTGKLAAISALKSGGVAYNSQLSKQIRIDAIDQFDIGECPKVISPKNGNKISL